MIVRDLTSGACAAPRPHLLTSSGPPHHWHLTFLKLPLGRDAILLRASDLKEIPPPSSSSVIQSSCYILVHRLSLLLSPSLPTKPDVLELVLWGFFCFFLFPSPKPSGCCCLWPKTINVTELQCVGPQKTLRYLHIILPLEELK